MCPTTALFGDSEVGEQGTGPRQSSPCPDSRLLLDRLVSLQGLSLFSLVLDSVFSHNSGLRLGFCSFLWGAGRVVISSLKRISHQRDRDRSGGGGNRTEDRLYANESSSRQLHGA